MKERKKAGNTRNTNTIKSAEFQSFCRILKRVFKPLQDRTDSLQADDDLYGANLYGAKNIPFIPTYLPEGEFIAWKKLPNNLIVKLKVMEDVVYGLQEKKTEHLVHTLRTLQ